MEFKKILKLEFSDYSAFNMYTLKRIFIMVPIISIGFTYLVLFREDYELDVLKFAIYAAVITILSPLVFFVLMKYSAKKSFMSAKTMQAPQEVKLNDTGVFTSGEFGNTNIPWQDILKVIEVKKAFYVYLLKMQAFVIPKRLISANENTLIRSIVKKSLPAGKYRLKE